MKISNSKKQLAKIIHENGGWRDGMSFSWYGNKTKMGYFSVQQPRFDNASGSIVAYGALGLNVVSFECEWVPNWHQTILSRDEYLHLYPAQDADRWIEWNGGACPVAEGTPISIRHRDGEEFARAFALGDHNVRWGHEGTAGDVVAYRLRPTEPAKSTAAGGDETNIAAKESPEVPIPQAKPTLEQLAADYRNRKDYADRKQQEADAAKADAEAKFAELVAAGKALGLVLSVACAEPELVITDVGDLLVGDEVRCVKPNGGLVEAGSVGVVVDIRDGKFYSDFPEQSRYVYLSSHLKRGDVAFVHRPAKGGANA